MWRGELPGRAAASPGLLRRRYSMPETIMRKYRLAQQRSETEEAGPASGTSAASTPPRGACGCCAGARPARRDRELMRKSALLRLWGRAGGSPCRVCCCCQPCGTRSLDGSRSELRHASGWTTPKRLRLDSSRDRIGEDVRADSELTYKSHVRNISSSVETATDALVASSSDSEGRARNVSTQYSEQISVTPSTEPASERPLATTTDSSALRVETDERSLTDSSDTFSTSMPTAKESSGIIVPKLSTQVSGSAHIDGRISERSDCAENDESNILPYDRPLTVETPSYEILEIVVSETLNVDPSPTLENEPDKLNAQTIRSPILKNKKKRNIDIDEYVSNILVESLNSLTDQLESMNASICADRKLSIVEKEIKVKLQNTGVNTIVHLSPTSNNQIIFGNEELYNSEDRRDNCNNLRDSHNEENIREEVPSLETNNNLTSAESTRYSNISTENIDKPSNDTFVNVTHHDNVNKAVLQQIQKLFQDELHNMDPEMNHSNSIPEISHIEISNVDVFIDNNGTFATSDTIEMQTQRQSDTFEVISGVGAGNYYEEAQDADAVVPRFSAFPHTDSMEVNTSSSEDAEVLGSECTSLVDSLDDPNSPRSVLLRKSFSNNKRSELVRSAIDVLDLLPENAQQGDSLSPKDKGESFFIRIKDDNCDCEKENIVVADHMPETIKQRLYRRHRKRELRMECARRSKVKQLKRELEKQQHKEISKTKKEIERECMAIINALIDDVIAKIAQDEYKCMRIKQRSNKLSATKSEENVSKKYWKRDTEYNNNKEIRLTKSDASQSCSEDIGRESRKSERHIRGKLSLQAHPPLTPEDGPRRIYQKSEIRDGTKCIEILEILEYVNSSQSSTDTINSDENQNSNVKNKKSRIPIPVYEKPSQRIYKSNGSRRNSTTMNERNGKTSHVLAGMLLDALSDEGETQDVHVRRASVPCEPRTRSNSLRFKRVFDIIPEERSSLSVESPDDAAYNRRASAPSLDSFRDDQDEKISHISEPIKTPRLSKESRLREMRSAGTSPMPDAYRSPVQVTVAAMTSPIRKSASTSPIKIARVVETTRERSWVQNAASGPPPRRPPAPRRDEEGQQNERRRSVPTQYEAPPPRRPVRSVHSDVHSMPSIADRNKKTHKEVQKSDNVRTGRRRSEMMTVEAGEDVIATSHATDHRKGQRCVPHVVKKVDRREAFPVDENEDGHGVTSDDRERRRERESFQYEVVRKARGRRAARGASEERARDETSSSSESGGSLLCSLAPAWLNARRRRRRAAHASGEWAVTVAGSCPAALPNDVEMRLRFPERAPAGREPPPAPPAPRTPRAPREPRAPRDLRGSSAHRCSVAPSTRAVECSAECGRSRRRALPDDSGRLTLTVKREASDSSILASKSVKKSTEPLPDLETYRASRSKTRSSVKAVVSDATGVLPALLASTRRAYADQK
ncbi:uncharacterized protein [Epargyreus clarus]|uniref:uncharacterized protein isoform X2 n=1 Tax=Epargyreus clarus TaxID=520877 RepID=UPI003C2EE317